VECAVDKKGLVFEDKSGEHILLFRGFYIGYDIVSFCLFDYDSTHRQKLKNLKR
jgi:hypothetical protein